ncbi:MAG: hypothetical protein ABS84_02660 [Rubrivivax sp. SCN 71-131]|nr:MAG: hypothetical protein ABS84_02660 [Rubrivivax sp. SCN 71-131]
MPEPVTAKVGAEALTARQQRHLAWLLLAWTAFIVYGSWVPLNFQAQDPLQVWQQLWSWSPASALRANRLDAAVNVLLTVPLGLGLALLWTPPGARHAGVWRGSGIVLMVLALSLLVEWGQGFLPGRSESMGDVLAQSAGTLLGLLLHALAGPRMRRRLAALDAALDARSRVAQMLHLYLLGLLLFALMPLDLTLDLGELYGKWRSARVLWLPFSGLRGTPADVLYELVTDVLLWLPVGLLWRLDAPRRGAARIAWRAALLALALEAAQLLVLSRVSDATDVLLAALGTWLGALVLPLLQPAAADGGARLRRMAGIAVLLWLPLVVWIYGWPFALRWPAPGGAAFAEAFLRIPFLTYFRRDEFGALNEILRKLLVFLPGGLLLRVACGRAAVANPSRVKGVSGVAALAALAFALEAGQVLLADRVADLTDALLATLGAAAGWRLAAWLQSGPTVSHAFAGSGRPLSRPAGEGRGEGAGTRPSSPATAGARACAPRHLLTIAALALAIGVLARLPGVPYNVAKLVPAGPAGVAAAIGLALAAWWLAALPVAAFARASMRLALALPLWLLLHGLVAFAVLRLSVPLPMLHKVIGAPVLGWPALWEDLLRYLALHAALLLPLCGAAALVQLLRDATALARLVYWALLAALFAWPLHWVVVERAATDNLTELMRGGGSLLASSSLAAAIMALGVAAGALACLPGVRGRRRPLLLALALALAGVPLALLAGLEPAVSKYGQVFSALQFILSAGRDAYAAPAELALRGGLALLACTGALAWLQRPWWQVARLPEPRRSAPAPRSRPASA